MDDIRSLSVTQAAFKLLRENAPIIILQHDGAAMLGQAVHLAWIADRTHQGIGHVRVLGLHVIDAGCQQ